MNQKTPPIAVDVKTEVLVVAIHNDILSRYQEILKKTELKSDSFEMEIFSNIRSSFFHDLAPVLLMDFGASKTNSVHPLSVFPAYSIFYTTKISQPGTRATKSREIRGERFA